MIDLTKEAPRTPTQAARHPFFRTPDDRPASAAKMWRMFNVGARPRGGSERVKLEFVQTPAGPRTSEQAIERFIGALNGQVAGPGRPRRSHDIAADEMAAAGFQ